MMHRNASEELPRSEDRSDDDDPITADLPLLETAQVSTPSDGRPRRKLVAHIGLGDRVFRGIAWGAGLSVLAIMTVVGCSDGPRLARGIGLRFLTTNDWQPDIHNFGIAAVLRFTS
jgi:phosphate transport system permease protein